MGHVSGHSVPVPHLGREGAAAHGRLPAAHRAAWSGSCGAAMAWLLRAPRLPCAAAGGAAGRCFRGSCTGFLHLDGYMDVCDAVLSRRDLATRQKILKDSHCGAFAVICMVLLAAGQCALFAGAPWLRLLPLGAIPVASRACASVAVQRLRPMGTSQYAAMQRGTGLQLVLPTRVPAGGLRCAACALRGGRACAACGGGGLLPCRLARLPAAGRHVR